MGLGQYIQATNFTEIGIIGTGYLGPLPFILLIVFKMFIAIRNKIKKGSFIDLENSNFWNKDGKFQRGNLIPLLGNWFANSVHVFIFTYSFRFAKMGGMN